MQAEPLSIAWGKRLRNRRARAGLNQTEVAALTGLSQSDVSRLESGEMLPGDDTRLRLADLFGETVETLFPYPHPSAVL